MLPVRTATPTARDMAPTAIAMRYEQIGTGCQYVNLRQPSATPAVVPTWSSRDNADISAVSGCGTVTNAEYVCFVDGESWHGSRERA